LRPSRQFSFSTDTVINRRLLIPPTSMHKLTDSTAAEFDRGQILAIWPHNKISGCV
jgi:hypothetical protein